MAKGESMGINPLSDRILVRREEQDEKTPGGIYIPANAREKLNVGTVLAVGRGEGARHRSGSRAVGQGRRPRGVRQVRRAGIRAR